MIAFLTKGEKSVTTGLNRIAVLLFLFTALATAAYAGEVTVTASLDRGRISLEDQAILTLSVTGADNAPAPALPDLPDFDVASAGRSSRISIINGAMSSRTEFAFVLRPKKAGDFTIGPAELQYKGKTYRSAPLTLQVTKSSAPESGEKDLFVTTGVDRTSPYVGEQLLFKLRFFSRIPVANASLEKLTFEGFQTVDAGKEKTSTATVNGTAYHVTEIRKLLIPVRAGALTIPAAVLECQVPVQGRQRTPGRFPGDDFFNFGFGRTTTKVLRSQPLTVRVRPLPADGRPQGFSGAVGSFTLSASLDKKEVKKGDSATLTLKIAGKGDLSAAARPVVRGIEQFKAYNDQPVMSRKVENDRLISEKTFKTALVPLYAGEQKLSEASFCYFDPGAGQYRKATARAPALRVLSGDREQARVVEGRAGGRAGRSVRIMGRDILPISTDLSPLRDETFRPLSPLAITFLLAPPFGFFGLFLFKRMRDKRSTDIGWARSSKALKRARTGLDEAARLADAGQTLALLSLTFKTYIGDKLNRAGEAMTPDEIREALRTRMSEGPLPERIMNLLRDLEMSQFAPRAAEADAPDRFLREARELMHEMEKVL